MKALKNVLIHNTPHNPSDPDRGSCPGRSPATQRSTLGLPCVRAPQRARAAVMWEDEQQDREEAALPGGRVVRQVSPRVTASVPPFPSGDVILF